MVSDEPMPMDGESGPKPYKLDRVDSDGRFVEHVSAYATEKEAHANRRPDWRYVIHLGNKQVWPVAK